MNHAIGENSSPAATTANTTVPPGGSRSRCQPAQTSVPTSTTSPSAAPTPDGRPNRTASPGSEALSTVSGTGAPKAIESQSRPLRGPHTAIPTSDATAADAIPARSGTQRRCIAGSSSTGASEGLSATVIPNRTAASTGLSRRSATQPPTRPTSSSG